MKTDKKMHLAMSDIETNKSLASDQPSRGDKAVNIMLDAMDLFTDDLKDNINVSKKMLPHGIDTELIAELKKALADPISHILDKKETMDDSIASFLTFLTKRFFESHTDKVANAYRTDLGTNKELHFSIVLNDDNFSNRSEILSFLSEYKQTKHWDCFPINFQFMPASIAAKIKHKEQLV